MASLWERESENYREKIIEIQSQKELLRELEKLFQNRPSQAEIDTFFQQKNLVYPYYYYIEALKRTTLPANTEDNVNFYYYTNNLYYKTHPLAMSNTWTSNDLTEEEQNATLNPQIIEYIDSKLPKDITDTLEKSIAIYILLGEIVRYDSKYLRHQDFSKLDPINAIDLSNNEIICRGWAIMYHKLLEHYQIPSSIYGKYHLSVTIPYKKAIYDADGFAFGQDEIMSDVGRIQFGLGISGLKVLEVPTWNEEEEYYKQQELEEKIDKVYKKLGKRNVSEASFTKRLTKLSRILEHSSKGNTKEEIEKRISLLNWFYHLPLGQGASLERYQMIRKYSHFLFGDFPFSSIHTTSVYEPTKDDVHVRRVIKIEDDQHQNHYFLQSQEGFTETAIEQFREAFQESILIPRHRMQAEEFFELPKQDKKQAIKVRK